MTIPKLERVADPVELEGDVRLALEIVARLEPPDDLRQQAFGLIVQLLCQRAVAQSPLGVAGLEAMAIPRSRGH